MSLRHFSWVITNAYVICGKQKYVFLKNNYFLENLQWYILLFGVVKTYISCTGRSSVQTKTNDLEAILLMAFSVVFPIVSLPLLPELQ
jgi:hypothetical protein